MVQPESNVVLFDRSGNGCAQSVRVVSIDSGNCRIISFRIEFVQGLQRRTDADSSRVASQVSIGSAIRGSCQVILAYNSGGVLEFQNAATQTIGWHDVRDRLSRGKAALFIIAEEECFVF